MHHIHHDKIRQIKSSKIMENDFKYNKAVDGMYVIYVNAHIVLVTCSILAVLIGLFASFFL